ncbi:unnamed protein product, partial [marine sediment metagenome]
EIGAGAKTLLIDVSTESVIANLEVPETLELYPIRTGLITVDNCILTINRLSKSVGPHKIFNCINGGTVVFGAGAAKEVDPESWGNNTIPGTTDMTAEIQAAIDSIKSNGGKISLLASNYLISSKLDLDTTGLLTIEGQSHSGGTAAAALGGTVITNSNDDDAIYIQSLQKVIIKNIDIFDSIGAGRTEGAGIHAVRDGNTVVHLENVKVHGHWDGFRIERPAVSTISHCTADVNLNHGFFIESHTSGVGSFANTG